MPTIDFEQFLTVDVRVGRIVSAALNAKAIKPAYVLEIDFGKELGTRTSSAQLTVHYSASELVGRHVCAVMNFEPRRVAGVKSEVLVLGVPDAEGAVVLLAPDTEVPLGGRMF